MKHINFHRRSIKPVANRSGGFTLVELLVVIGIIALLITILLPVLRKAMDSAKSIACQSNLRQIGIGFLQYANSNRNELPPLAEHYQSNPVPRSGTKPTGMHWYEFLGEQNYLPQGWVADPMTSRGYMTGIWRCPGVTDEQIFSQTGSWGWGGGYGVCGNASSFVFRFIDNYAVPPATPSAPARLGGPNLAHVKFSTDRWLVGDSGRPAGTAGTWLTWMNVYATPTAGYDPSSSAGSSQDQPATRHSQRANVCFFDGHVEAVPFGDLNVPYSGGKNRFFGTAAEMNAY